MKELALNILDVAKNSVKAGADRIVIRIEEKTAGAPCPSSTTAAECRRNSSPP